LSTTEVKSNNSACILFDLDGTIWDSLPGIDFSLRTAFAQCGLPLKRENLREMIGPPIRTILSTAGGVEGSRLDDLERAFRQSYDKEGWRKTVCFPDAVRVLRKAHLLKYRLFVVSNKPRQASMRGLNHEGILDLFEEVVTADSRMPPYSTKAEMVDALLKRPGIDPRVCLLVGDTIEDAKAAEAARIRFAFMTHGYGEVPQSASALITFRLDSFGQLLPLLERELICD
jgi:phosphoglycolate phosphatase